MQTIRNVQQTSDSVVRTGFTGQEVEGRHDRKCCHADSLYQTFKSGAVSLKKKSPQIKRFILNLYIWDQVQLQVLNAGAGKKPAFSENKHVKTV